jgi:hypothetical protein
VSPSGDRPSIDKLTGETVLESNQRRYPERFPVGQNGDSTEERIEALEKRVALLEQLLERHFGDELTLMRLQAEPPSRGRSDD